MLLEFEGTREILTMQMKTRNFILQYFFSRNEVRTICKTITQAQEDGAAVNKENNKSIRCFESFGLYNISIGDLVLLDLREESFLEFFNIFQGYHDWTKNLQENSMKKLKIDGVFIYD